MFTKLGHSEVTIKMNNVLKHYTQGTSQYQFMEKVKTRLERLPTTLVEASQVFEAIKATMGECDSLGHEKPGKITHRLFQALFGLPNPFGDRMGELQYRDGVAGQGAGLANTVAAPRRNSWGSSLA